MLILIVIPNHALMMYERFSSQSGRIWVRDRNLLASCLYGNSTMLSKSKSGTPCGYDTDSGVRSKERTPAFGRNTIRASGKFYKEPWSPQLNAFVSFLLLPPKIIRPQIYTTQPKYMHYVTQTHTICRVPNIHASNNIHNTTRPKTSRRDQK